MPEILPLIAVGCASFVAGYINMMAGGGSLLPVSLMLLFGVEGAVANGTNRVGIFTSGISGVLQFRKGSDQPFRQSLPYALATVPGAIAGALFSTMVDTSLFEKLLGGVILFVIFTLFFSPKPEQRGGKPSWLLFPVLVMIGFYGGFMQIGVGFLLMAAFLHLGKFDLLKTNALKVTVTMIFTIPALLIYILTDSINWHYAVALGVGNYLGAHVGVVHALKKGERLVKTVLAIVLVALAIKFFFF